MQCWIVSLDTCASQLSEKRHPAQTSISHRHITIANFASCGQGEFLRITLNKVWIYQIGNVVFSGLSRACDIVHHSEPMMSCSDLSC